MNTLDRIVFVVSLTVVAAGLPSIAPAQDVIQWKQESHIAYYDEATMKKADPYLKEKCYLNIEYPANRTGFATLIYLHGGGLRMGTPTVPECYRKRNFAIVMPGYRLSPKVKCPAYIEDTAAAVAWTLKNIHRFGGNPNKVFLSGGSGGGYLAAMVGMDGKYLGKYGLKPQQLAGIIPMSGQMTTHLNVKEERGIPFTRQVIDEYAPIYHVASNLPPFLVVVGDPALEWPARVEENAFFVAAMRVAGHTKTTYYQLNGLTHGTIYEGAVVQTCDFIDRICRELDAAGLPTDTLITPKVPPAKDKEIENQVYTHYGLPFLKDMK